MQDYREFKLKRIMVATDFSGGSYGALNYANQLARTFSAKVYLLHVVEQNTSPAAKPSGASLADRFDMAEAELQRIASSLSHENIACTTIARAGKIHDVVLGLVREREIDLLVVGTYGRSGLTNGKLGSVAEMFLRVLPCPVLTVGAGARSNAYKSAYKHSVLFPTDFSGTSKTAFPFALSLAAHLNGDLILLHAENTSSDSQVEKSLKALASEIAENNVKRECLIRTGTPADSIIAVAIERRVDFIVMGVHSPDPGDKAHNYGTALEVISKSRCPVFTLFSGWQAGSLAPAAA